jgi:hypothetical protein
MEEGDSNRSEVSVSVTFLTKLSNKEIYFIKTLRLELIKSNCLIGDIPTPLNCSKVSANNSYKALQGKYKITQILKNVCPG